MNNRNNINKYINMKNMRIKSVYPSTQQTPVLETKI